jgi:hypothetical protein
VKHYGDSDFMLGENGSIKKMLWGGIGGLVENYGGGVRAPHDFQERLQQHIISLGYAYVGAVVSPAAFGGPDISVDLLEEKFPILVEATLPYTAREIEKLAKHDFENWPDLIKEIGIEVVKQVILAEVKRRVRNYLIKKIGTKVIPLINMASALYDAFTGEAERRRVRNMIGCILLHAKGSGPDDLHIAAKILGKILAEMFREEIIKAIVKKAAEKGQKAIQRRSKDDTPRMDEETAGEKTPYEVDESDDTGLGKTLDTKKPAPASGDVDTSAPKPAVTGPGDKGAGSGNRGYDPAAVQRELQQGQEVANRLKAAQQPTDAPPQGGNTQDTPQGGPGPQGGGSGSPGPNSGSSGSQAGGSTGAGSQGNNSGSQGPNSGPQGAPAPTPKPKEKIKPDDEESDRTPVGNKSKAKNKPAEDDEDDEEATQGKSPKKKAAKGDEPDEGDETKGTGNRGKQNKGTGDKAAEAKKEAKKKAEKKRQRGKKIGVMARLQQKWGNVRAAIILRAISQRDRLRAAWGNVAKGLFAHHLVPVTVLKNNEVAQAAVIGGFEFNGKKNGRLLNQTEHAGGHDAYNEMISQEMNEWAKNNPGYSPQQARDFLESRTPAWSDMYVQSQEIRAPQPGPGSPDIDPDSDPDLDDE